MRNILLFTTLALLCACGDDSSAKGSQIDKPLKPGYDKVEVNVILEPENKPAADVDVLIITNTVAQIRERLPIEPRSTYHERSIAAFKNADLIQTSDSKGRCIFQVPKGHRSQGVSVQTIGDDFAGSAHRSPFDDDKGAIELKIRKSVIVEQSVTCLDDEGNPVVGAYVELLERRNERERKGRPYPVYETSMDENGKATLLMMQHDIDERPESELIIRLKHVSANPSSLTLKPSEFGGTERKLICNAKGRMKLSFVGPDDKPIQPTTMRVTYGVLPKEFSDRLLRAPHYIAPMSSWGFGAATQNGTLEFFPVEFNQNIAIETLEYGNRKYHYHRELIPGPTAKNPSIEVTVKLDLTPVVHLKLLRDDGEPLSQTAVRFHIKGDTGWTSSNHGTIFTDGDGKIAISLIHTEPPIGKGRPLTLTSGGTESKPDLKVVITKDHELVPGPNDLGTVKLEKFNK